MFRPDSYHNIKRYVDRYKEVIENIGPIAAPSTDEDVFAVLMEKENVKRLLGHPDCEKLAAIIGIDDEGEVTVSLLIVDSNNDILAEHKLPDNDPGNVKGEEVWPDRVVLGDVDIFLT